jgi:hypothetical protein
MQLVRSGVDPSQIVWLISDQETNRDTSGMPVTATRVTEYELMDYHQIYVGTPTALAKLCMSSTNLYIPPPLVVMVFIASCN